jgi:Holliday junction DNA helicase RuvA
VIGSLRGVVLDRVGRSGQAAEVLLEVGGVGYRVLVPSSALGQIGRPGSPAFLHVHTHVRDDAIILYGFPSRDERACFEALIGAHGVGPAVALALLSVHSPAALQRAVLNDDADALMLVPGVGKKTAIRLLVELKARLDIDLDRADLHLLESGSIPGDGAGAGDGSPAATRSEVRAALSGLGYGADEIRQALGRLPVDGRLEDQIRLALRELAGAR